MSNIVYGDRVKETTATTGTGTYSLAGAVSGYRTFDDALDSSERCSYHVEDGAGNYEVGIGTFTAPSSLARTTVLISSNANAAVSWGAGTKTVALSLSATRLGLATQVHNLSATVPPVTTDDETAGYQAGSIWVDLTQGVAYICLSSDGSSARWASFGGGAGAKPSIRNSMTLGAGRLNTNPFAQVEIVPLSIYTPGNTEVPLQPGGDAAYFLVCPPNGMISVTGEVACFDPVNGEASSWTIAALLIRSGTGNPTLVDSDVVVVHQSAGTIGSVALAVSNPEDALLINVTGEAATDIYWVGNIRVNTITTVA